ncbi:MAG: hypothetical protein HQ481_20330 [Alphaproteobacteria bacterium]|nr:hypothetical protein [Alphaproteobacteria bacterium]
MSKFDDLLADDVAPRRYLAIIEPYNPATSSVITLYFSDHGFVTEPTDTPPNTYFEPRLTTALNFERHLFADQRLSGRSVPGFGVLSITNVDGNFDGMVDYAYDGRRVRVLLGGEDFAYDEFGLIFDGTVEQLEFTEETLSLRLRDLQTRFEGNIARTDYGGTGGADGRVGLKGQRKPVVFGRAFRVPAVLVDPSQLLYQVHDGAIEAVDAVYDKGVVLTFVASAPAAGQYSVDVAAGTISLGASPAGTVTADVRGDKTGGVYAETVGSVVKRLATTRLTNGTPLTVDDTAFQAFETLHPQPIGLFLDNDARMIDVLDDLVESVGAHYGFDRPGTLTIGRIEAPSTTAVAAFDERQILKIERVAVSHPIWRQRIAYRRYWRTLDESGVAGSVSDEDRADLGEQHRYEVAEDTTVSDTHPLAEESDRETLLALSVDAAAEAARQLALFGADRDAFQVRLKTQPFAIDLGNTITLTYPRYGLEAGRNLVVIGMVEDAAVNEVTLDLWG